MPQPITFHDLLDPFTGDRTSLRLDGGAFVDRAETLPGSQGVDLDASSLWVLPALYDADAHFPVETLGLRAGDIYASLVGGVVDVNIALQWQAIKDVDLGQLVADLSTSRLPRITPILSVHSDLVSDGFGDWLATHADMVKAVMPPVCKLYSYSANFWSDLDSVFAAGLLPIIYCRDLEAVEGVVKRSPGPVHFRHAISGQLVSAMSKLPGATLQTSPHFLLPIEAAHRSQLHVLPPVADDDVRLSLADVFLDQIDLLVSDHNAPPFGAPDGPGLQVEQSFLSSILTAATQYEWPLERVWAKATTAPAARYGIDRGAPLVVVDPGFTQETGLWPPRQTSDRAPYLGSVLQGRVIAVGSDRAATLV
jgi:dihydroorotase-like cyclic amidohydrolase